jgi:hypothetical protein
MPRPAKDLTAHRFGKLLVLRRLPTVGGYIFWLCRCDCGREKPVRTGALVSGSTQSCGVHGWWRARDAARTVWVPPQTHPRADKEGLERRVVKRLRARGLSWGLIARRLGVSKTKAWRLFHSPEDGIPT